ncbi:YbhB/YbcL family Raf kinase inhibitor-like protein [Cochlodiniinecator piscidefendens]|uniref:YbhB/YbcL family Raf kinase inhibitor-like protein n=1 Tax=Cochlodiniinecator piscidefendens TaxID=2715756 RepID=UPI0014082FBB|nr:YbhB/YbcL family Raf kinase inhibitor-like protein [Cochlodiniinecator piscidefendens]
MLRSSLFSTLLYAGLTATPAIADTFQLSSPDIIEGQQLATQHVFKGFGCEGGNIAPSLSWTGAPEGTESFAITVYDPDAPTGSGWWHWFAFDIPSDVTEFPSEAMLSDTVVELKNDYGTVGFGGACPPAGEVHRYEFTVYALGSTLNIDETVSNALAGFMVRANSLASSTITAVYNR